jgi:hypothetical protein
MKRYLLDADDETLVHPLGVEKRKNLFALTNQSEHIPPILPIIIRISELELELKFNELTLSMALNLRASSGAMLRTSGDVSNGYRLHQRSWMKTHCSSNTCKSFNCCSHSLIHLIHFNSFA